MRRWLIITLGSIAVLVVVGVMVVSWWINQPMYYPGGIASRTDLNPPDQTQNAETWTVGDGIELYHYSVGTGRNVLVIHGGPGIPTTEAYAGLEELGNRYRFHYYDQRGCGKSARLIRGTWSSNTYDNILLLEGSLGIGAQVSDIERIRHIIGDEQLIIIGHSYGAFLATLYAAEFPDHVEALILVSPADLLVLPSANGGIFSAIRSLLPNNEKPPFDSWLERYLDLGKVFEKSVEDLLNEDLDFARFYQIASLPFRVETPNKSEIGAWMIRAQYFSMGSKHDYREALSTVKAPVLVIHGKNDIQAEAVSQFYTDALPNARMQIINDAGHFPQYDKAAEFVALISDFLSVLSLKDFSKEDYRKKTVTIWSQ